MAIPKDILKSLNSDVEGLQVASIFGADGLPLIMNNPGSVDVDAFSAKYIIGAGGTHCPVNRTFFAGPTVRRVLVATFFPFFSPTALSSPAVYGTSKRAVNRPPLIWLVAIALPFNSSRTVSHCEYTATRSGWFSWPGQVQLASSMRAGPAAAANIGAALMPSNSNAMGTTRNMISQFC